jgi:hypothetical protein
MITKEKHPMRVLFFRDHEKAFEGLLPGVQAHLITARSGGSRGVKSDTCVG